MMLSPHLIRSEAGGVLPRQSCLRQLTPDGVRPAPRAYQDLRAL